MAHFRSDLALVPLEDFTIEYVWDYMGRQVRGDKYRDLLKVHQEHFFQARTGITTFVNDGGKPGIFGFTSSSRNKNCPPEVFKKRWDRLAKELSPKAIKEPANKIDLRPLQRLQHHHHASGQAAAGKDQQEVHAPGSLEV
jgi:hypothetical protein